LDGSGQAAEQLPLAALSASRNAELAAALVNFVLPDEGQDTLESYGFMPG
jgi:ABC-type molybdate transport system substrate-binding protein